MHFAVFDITNFEEVDVSENAPEPVASPPRSRWRPVSAKPRDDVPIVMKGDSQMRAPHNVIYISGRFQLCSLWDQWRTTDRTHVSEHGWIITHWCYVEELEAAMGG